MTLIHTVEVSPCGCMKAQDLVKLYKGKGYNGIIITDHYYLRYFKELGAINWYDKINSYLLDYYKAKEAGYKYGLTVLLGIELMPVKVRPNHLLIYGIDEEFLLNNPKLYEYSLDDLKNLKTGCDILIYQAHLCRAQCSIISHSESMVRFVMGDMSLDKDWDKYLAELEKLKYKEILEVDQKAWDRTKGK